MQQSPFAIITPSYLPDLDRCRLLCESIQTFVKPPYKHYLIVDRRDFARFTPLASPETEVLTVEDIVPLRVRRSPLSNKVWLSFKTIPIRNWLLQQLVKIEIARSVSEENIVFVDSDVVFVRPFDLQSLLRNEKLRLYRDKKGNDLQKKIHYKWHQSSAKLLGTASIDSAIPDYIGNLITWKRSNVDSLCQHIENISNRSWFETVGNTWHFSEYVLYGTYVSQILKQDAGHYCQAVPLSHDYWQPVPLSDDQLQHFFSTLQPEQVAVMLSAKAGIPVEKYAHFLKQIST